MLHSPCSSIHIILLIDGVLEQLQSLVEFRNLGNLISCQSELLSFEIVDLVIKINRLWNDNIVPGESPVEYNLCLTSAVLGSQVLDERQLGQVVSLGSNFCSKSAEWTVGNWHDFMVH